VRAVHASADLERIFDACFEQRCNTVLRGGADEPLYTPASDAAPARIDYRADYFASALHEIAHWCVAGVERRQKLDFGYWYAPDGRTAKQQAAFEHVESKPQALEWIFAEAAGARFVLSADNLEADCGPSESFALAVQRERDAWRARGLPARAARFEAALRAFYGT